MSNILRFEALLLINLYFAITGNPSLVWLNWIAVGALGVRLIYAIGEYFES